MLEKNKKLLLGSPGLGSWEWMDPGMTMLLCDAVCMLLYVASYGFLRFVLDTSAITTGLNDQRFLKYKGPAKEHQHPLPVRF